MLPLQWKGPARTHRRGGLWFVVKLQVIKFSFQLLTCRVSFLFLCYTRSQQFLDSFEYSNKVQMSFVTSPVLIRPLFLAEYIRNAAAEVDRFVDDAQDCFRDSGFGFRDSFSEKDEVSDFNEIFWSIRFILLSFSLLLWFWDGFCRGKVECDAAGLAEIRKRGCDI